MHCVPALAAVSTRAPAVIAGLALLAACALPGAALAQSWPAKPVRMVIPWPPGGGADITGRVVAEALAPGLGQPVVVENRGGSNGMLGAEAVARSAPDGYTLMFHSVTSHMLNPSFFPKLPYDTINDFSMVSLVASVPLVIVAHPSLPVKALADLIALARKQPGAINWASFGAGSISHLSGVLFDRTFGIRTTHVPYKGGGPALIDTLGGHVPVYFSGIGTSLANIRAGRLRALAVTSAARTRLLPDVPTVDEATGTSGYEAAVMFGLFAPARTPAEIVTRLNGELARLLGNPDFVTRLHNQAASDPASALGPAEMLAYIRAHMPKLAQLVRETGVKID